MAQAPADRPRILVVEDEFLIRMTLVEALGDEGFEVLEAETADEALPMALAEAGLRLLLTDVQLPGKLDGRGLADSVRTKRPELPILFMTGRPDSSAVSGPLERSIAKPYTLADICATVRAMIGPE